MTKNAAVSIENLIDHLPIAPEERKGSAVIFFSVLIMIVRRWFLKQHKLAHPQQRTRSQHAA